MFVELYFVLHLLHHLGDFGKLVADLPQAVCFLFLWFCGKVEVFRNVWFARFLWVCVLFLKDDRGKLIVV